MPIEAQAACCLGNRHSVERIPLPAACDIISSAAGLPLYPAGYGSACAGRRGKSLKMGIAERRHRGSWLQNVKAIRLRKLSAHKDANKRPDLNIRLLMKYWLSGDAWPTTDLNSKALAAANLIREQYQPPVLVMTAGSLKPDAIKFMQQVDRWMADGIVLLFERAANPDAGLPHEWWARP